MKELVISQGVFLDSETNDLDKSVIGQRWFHYLNESDGNRFWAKLPGKASWQNNALWPASKTNTTRPASMDKVQEVEPQSLFIR